MQKKIITTYCLCLGEEVGKIAGIHPLQALSEAAMVEILSCLLVIGFLLQALDEFGMME